MTERNHLTPDASGFMLNGLRCPRCGGTGRFVVQVLTNMVVESDGFDVFGHTPELDHFEAAPVDPMSGSRPNDPMGCANRDAGDALHGCGFTGTVADFVARGGAGA